MNYKLLENQFRALLTGRFLTDMSNATSFLNEHLTNINWVGFYLLEGETLYLGPFQGKVACTTIPITKGVCGASVVQKKILIVPDVSLFSGHIACDSRSKSEIVFPLYNSLGDILGVLDIDSPILNRFNDQEECIFLENITKIFSESMHS